MEEQILIKTTQTAPLHKLHLQKLQKMSRRKQIIAILQAHHKRHRSFKIINELITLIKEEPLFQSFAHNYRVINQVCQKIQYRTFEKGQTIYKLKERGDYFYLILQGTVHLTVPEVIRTIVLNTVQKVEQNISPSQRQLFNAFLDIQEYNQRDNQNIITQPQIVQNSPVEQVQKIIQIIEQGQSFGQMMQDSVLRMTNAQAFQQCHVLYLDKQSYETLLKAQLKSQNQNKYNLLEGLAMFKHIPPFAISRISVMMKEFKFLYGQALFRCGDIIKNIYIIINGSFKLLRKINRHSRVSRISPTTKFEYKIDIQDKRNAEYLIVNEGQILGDIQTIEMKNNYQESCICESQQAIVLAIDKKQLFKILLQDQDNFAKVKETILIKNIWKDKIINSFVQKRNRNSLMNSYLSNPKHSYTEISKQSRDINLKQQIQNQNFFYNQFNKTIQSTPSKCRFSISKPKSCTQTKPSNLVVPRNIKKQGIPHGIVDIVSLVKLKSEFQKRFRKDRKQKFVFKFNKDEVPLYIKNRFSKFQ